MAEATADLRSLPKEAAYAALEQQILAVLDAIDDPIAAMATMSCLIHHGFGHLWVGFYRLVDHDLLRVGPYQGTLGCLEIRVGNGVCGTAARDRRTVVVADVRDFAGHIACDARARSEIVVPVLDREGRLAAVLDVDSERVSAFDEVDARWLERLVSWFARP
jgi:GAF domain-containing protein